tara:strand:- start:12604 stop:13296 length:693 start_codon:yes stop_codon:yes gene_type:complete
MKQAIFLDFDGVIVDSIKECYLVSKDTYFGFINNYKSNKEYEKLFHKYRYLVGPVPQYMVLHRVLDDFCNNKIMEIQIKKHFKKLEKDLSNSIKNHYEYIFFKTRDFYKKDLKKWVELHSLTMFGKTLQNKVLGTNYNILTTKDKKSVELLCDFYNINISNIFSNKEYNLNGSKGKIISDFIDRTQYESAIFIDDSVHHLNTVKDKRVKLYFANWGYDKSPNKYEVYDYI